MAKKRKHVNDATGLQIVAGADTDGRVCLYVVQGNTARRLTIEEWCQVHGQLGTRVGTFLNVSLSAGPGPDVSVGKAKPA